MRRHSRLGLLLPAAGLLLACGSSSSNATKPRDGGTGDSATSPHGDSGTVKDSGGSPPQDSGPAGDGAQPPSDSSVPPVDAGPTVGASVLQFHNHINRDGFYVDGALTEAKAATFALDSTFSGQISGNVYASPVYVENGPGGKGTFYVATEDATVFALDETTGQVTWQKNVGMSASNTGAGCGNIGPIGITGTPAIDLATRLLVFDAASADSSGNIATHTVYGMSIDDGSVKWQVDVSTLTDGMGLTFSPQPQNERGAILIVNGVAYVPFGGHYGDCGDYHGWVVAVPLSGTGATAWATQVGGAGIWGVSGAASDGQNVFVTTGNGQDQSMTWAGSEGLFRLSPTVSFSGNTMDYFVPYDWYSLDQGDVDLSGSGPLVIDSPSMTPSALVMAQGKDGYLYLVDRSDLGGIAMQSGPANVGALQVQSGEITNGGAWANVGGTTYVVVRPNGNNGGVGCPNGTSGDLVAVKLDMSAAQKMSVVWCANSQGVGSPAISTSDGTKDPMVWVQAAEGSGMLYAWDLVSGTQVFNGGGASAQNVRRFSTPIAVHGRIFVAGDGQLYAFAAK